MIAAALIYVGKMILGFFLVLAFVMIFGFMYNTIPSILEDKGNKFVNWLFASPIIIIGGGLLYLIYKLTDMLFE